MAATLRPPPGGDINRGADLTAVFCSECGVALIFVLSRAWARYRIQSLGPDDWFMFATMALFMALTIVVSVMASKGGGRHAYYLSEQQLLVVEKLGYIAQPIASVAQALSKISVALLLRRILLSVLSTKRKWFLWMVIVVTGILAILQSFLTFYQCSNPRALWNPAVAKTTKCWNPNVQANFAVFTSSWNVAMDFLLALFPVTILYALQISRDRKMAISILLGLGIFSGICAAIKTAKLSALASKADPLWAQYDLYVWVATELCVVIICGSIPTLKVLYDRYFSNKTPSQIYFSLRNLLSRHSTAVAKSQNCDRDSIRASQKYPHQKQDEATYQLNDRFPMTSTTIVGNSRSEESWVEAGLARAYSRDETGSDGNIKVDHTFEVI